MTFGIFQEFYSDDDSIKGPKSGIGVIGTTMNGVMYLSMPVLSTLLDNTRWASHRRTVAITGVCLSSVAYLISSFSTHVWHLVALQGVLAALGGAMLYSPSTLFLDEWFQSGNKATAYGLQLSSKNIVGTACPFLMYVLLDKLGFRGALKVWAAIVLVTGIVGLYIIPSAPMTSTRRTQRVPWSFLKHRTFYIYAFANIAFSSGYGLPQTYLPTYATGLLHLSSVLSVTMIALFNIPGIISSTAFGLLNDKAHLSASSNTLISALGSSLAVFLLWGLRSNQIPALLISFSLTYGFFAGGFSATWGGWIQELENEAVANNEAINTGMVYGFFNGARGVGYIVGGLVGVELLDAGAVVASKQWAYGSEYGALILFTGISAVIGGWSVAWKPFACAGGRRVL